MSDYIDRVEAIKAITCIIDHHCITPYKTMHDAISHAQRILLSVPTADVVEVVRCKDCFYAKPYNAKWQLPIKENELWCTNHEEEKTQGWFCADAIERMVEDGEIH